MYRAPTSFRVAVAASGLVLSGLAVYGYSRVRSFRISKQRILAVATEAKDVIIVNKPEFEKKVAKLVEGGFGNLQVIADFDRTITRSTVNGKRGDSCHGVIESLPALSAEYKAATSALFDKYFPIETCATRTKEEKIPLMYEWYTQAHAALLKEHFTEENVADAVRSANLELRDGWCNVMGTLQDRKVPLLIFSAGIANVIQEVMAQKFGAVADSTHIVSNWIRFGPDGKLESFSEPLIHMFNKDSSQTKGHAYSASVAQRTNAILLGDGLGDVTMAEGIPHDIVLKVGFLNDKVDLLLPKYRQVYDILVLNDGSMKCVETILAELK